jgi:hypothetical protein
MSKINVDEDHKAKKYRADITFTYKGLKIASFGILIKQDKYYQVHQEH